MSCQSLTERIAAAQHSTSGSAISKAVCKATTHEVSGPKKRHLDYLIHCSSEQSVSVPHLADTLLDRTHSTSWVVVFKALISTHHLMMYGNERLIQYLASKNSVFKLNTFLDKAALQGYDMSTFIRRYSRYLNEKAVSYRLVAMDVTKMKRGAEGVMRTMTTDKLIQTLPIIQNQLDALLEFQANSTELTNGVINTAFMLLFKDSIRLFAAYNEGVINMLEKYFVMKKSQCQEALEIYRTFLDRMTKLSLFLRVAERVGIGGSSPGLKQAPSSLLEALEQHLASLEGRQINEFSSASSPVEDKTGDSHLPLKGEGPKVIGHSPRVLPSTQSVGSANCIAGANEIFGSSAVLPVSNHELFSLQPMDTMHTAPSNHNAWGGDLLKPAPHVHQGAHLHSKMASDDLDASLANLVGNLQFGCPPAKKLEMPWGPLGEKKPSGGWQTKTGYSNANWTHGNANWTHGNANWTQATQPVAPAPIHLPQMNGVLYASYAPAPVTFPMTTPQVPLYGMLPHQMGHMTGVPMMSPQPVLYNHHQPVLRPANPFGHIPGTQMHFM
ncbi:LOW QUALITY PROTEIN: phosphatidylinositol-binding clathrin assembly protein-like [Aplochiton taeniatus]